MLSYSQTFSWSTPTFICWLEIEQRPDGAWWPRHFGRGTILAYGPRNHLIIDPFRSPWISAAFYPLASFLRFGGCDWNAFGCCYVGSGCFGPFVWGYWWRLIVRSSALFCAEYSLDKRAHIGNCDWEPGSLCSTQPGHARCLCSHFCSSNFDSNFGSKYCGSRQWWTSCRWPRWTGISKSCFGSCTDPCLSQCCSHFGPYRSDSEATAGLERRVTSSLAFGRMHLRFWPFGKFDWQLH